MASLSWWRSWHGAPTDHKWQVIAMRSGVKVGIVSAVAWALLDYASQHAERGTVDGFDTEMYAVYSGFDETEVTAVIKAMTDKGVIVLGRLSAWDKRQPKREDDNSTERVRKWRDMKRNVTQGNAPDKELREQIKDTDNRLTDKETDKERDEEDPAADPFDVYQRTLETNGLMLSGAADIKSLNEILSMGATVEDMLNGLSWKVKNNDGKAVRYVSQIVGPTKTALAKRRQSFMNQNNNGHKKEEYHGAVILPGGEINEV